MFTGIISPNMGRRKGLNVQDFDKSIDQAFQNKNVKAVALLVNSPGGSPVQSDFLAKRIVQLSNEKNIPVIEDTLHETENKNNETENKNNEQHIPIEITNYNNELDVHSEFNFDEKLFLNTASNDIIDEPNELFKFNPDIKVVNIHSEEKDKLDSNKEKNNTEKKNFLDKFESHHSN